MRYRLALAILGGLVGCGGNGAGVTSGPDMATAPLVGKLCTDARADAWTLPIHKTSEKGTFAVTLMASQAPVPVIGDNHTTWTVQVADPNGAPLAGATLTATPYMPDHHHGTSVPAAVTPAATAGQYTIEPLYFFMAGYWQITIAITAGDVSDSVVFSLCLTDA